MMGGCLFSLLGAYPNGNNTLVSDFIDSDAISSSGSGKTTAHQTLLLFTGCLRPSSMFRSANQLCGTLNSFGMSNATCLSANKDTCNDVNFYKGHTGSEFIQALPGGAVRVKTNVTIIGPGPLILNQVEQGSHVWGSCVKGPIWRRTPQVNYMV